jgi:hypothetical protein
MATRVQLVSSAPTLFIFLRVYCPVLKMYDTLPTTAEDLFSLGNAFPTRGECQDEFVCFDRVRTMRRLDPRVYNNLGAADFVTPARWLGA